MSITWSLAFIGALAVAAFFVCRWRTLSLTPDGERPHALPSFYAFNGVISVAVPALLLLGAWLLIQPVYLEQRVSASIPESAAATPGERSLIMSDVRRIATGLNIAVDRGALSPDQARDIRADFSNVRNRLASVGVAVGSDVSQVALNAAQQWRAIQTTGTRAMYIAVAGLALGGFVYAFSTSRPTFNARAAVERGILVILMGAALVAILTTVGIVLSMLFETFNFFQQYPWTEFYFSTDWNPRFQGGSDLGMLPLLWGTLYISFIALLVAVPIGLFSAIYLSEYASKPVRSVAKPLIEILAGIPTIVYGLFALITVGPLLRDYFAEPLGLGDSGSSVMTAGLVMGIMLIPFVSSLSDDIINAVPQSMRDGSFGLGATKSETIRQVIVPAALPGIVGAILLAASRAIGETMIVVLGAGAAARIDLNPFEAMTTVTVKIVSQLTGDTDFSSPETLVAFALGLTLFVITLGLNVLALYIVRKYREQYE